MKRNNARSINRNGFTSIDLVLGSSLLSTVLAISSQYVNTSLDASQNNLQHSKINNAITSRIEKIREVAFYHLCEKSKDKVLESGCLLNNSNQPKYNITQLKPHCKNKTLGTSLLEGLKSHDANLADDFNLTDYDKSAEPVLITSSIKTSGNQLELSFNSKYHTPFSTIIVPKAETWCA